MDNPPSTLFSPKRVSYWTKTYIVVITGMNFNNYALQNETAFYECFYVTIANSD